MKKKEHPLVPVAEYDVPDEGDFTAGHIRSNTVFLKKPTNDEIEEDENEEENKSSKNNRIKSKYPNINEIHDYYASSFGKPAHNIRYFSNPTIFITNMILDL